ncbi:Tubulin binding cofactor C-domain-containing protein [Madurella fahalii]|uniref:Tubulin binding cofactor C-domain-containing protein n=1 Tax=Madurella fahalii TaxID=1157608 RepID=A0ABQ0GIH2_9PEZI
MDSKERFYRQFQDSAATLQDQITQLSTFAAVGGERQDAIEHILSGISRLSNEVADAADYVPAYDQRTYSDVIKALKEQLNEATAAFAPKTRFRFKPRAAAEADTTSPTAETATKHDTRHLNSVATTTATTAGSDASATAEEKQDSISSLPTIGGDGGGGGSIKNYNDEIARPSAITGAIRKPSFSTARDVALYDHEHVHILLPPSASRATSAGTLTNLSRCVVDMSVPTIGGAAPFASLTLRGINSSVVVAGHVDGPVHVTGVRDSVVMVTARQVRIHECENVVFYLHCVSRPIIEDCTGVRFAPAPESYLTDKEKRETNMWDQVDDFKWLKSTASPNWALVSKQDIISDDVWKKTLIGNPGLGVDDILKILGVGKGT